METNKVYLLFAGYHDVATASDVLNMYSINNDIVRTPISMGRGCSFSVRISETDEAMSRYVLGTKGIKMI